MSLWSAALVDCRCKTFRPVYENELFVAKYAIAQEDATKLCDTFSIPLDFPLEIDLSKQSDHKATRLIKL